MSSLLKDPLNELFTSTPNFRKTQFIMETKQWAKLIRVLVNHKQRIERLQERVADLEMKGNEAKN